MSAGAVLEGKDRLPVAFHVHDRPAPCGRLVQSLGESSNLGIAVVGPFTIRVGVMHDQTKPRTWAGRRPLKHLQVAVRIAKGSNGPSANDLRDRNDLP